MQRFLKWLQDAWYQEMYLTPLIVPFSLFYLDAVRFRRFLYRIGLKKATALPVPVIIVGNISVGGTGKTPLVIWLAKFLQQNGYKPGIISRGYGGSASNEVTPVTADSTAAWVGDEARLIYQHCGYPQAIARNRVAAGRYLLNHHDVDIIIADDGLQHYALKRDIEIAVIDGARRFGNGYCLPAGPLREPVERLNEVDLVIVNGISEEEHEFSMRFLGEQAVNLKTGATLALSQFTHQPCRAVAAIGNPQRFFKRLQDAGLTITTQAYPDHYVYQASDICFNDLQPVLMTEKDAVKCQSFATERHWYVPIEAYPEPAFAERLLNIIQTKIYGKKTA